MNTIQKLRRDINEIDNLLSEKGIGMFSKATGYGKNYCVLSMQQILNV